MEGKLTGGSVEGRGAPAGKAGLRRRRYYRLTRKGQTTLARQRGVWDTFFVALKRIARIRAA